MPSSPKTAPAAFSSENLTHVLDPPLFTRISNSVRAIIPTVRFTRCIRTCGESARERECNVLNQRAEGPTMMPKAT